MTQFVGPSTRRLAALEYCKYTSYHGCFDKGINNGDCQKYETGSQIDMDYQHRVVTPYMPKMLVDVLLRLALPVLLIVVGCVLILCRVLIE